MNHDTTNGTRHAIPPPPATIPLTEDNGVVLPASSFTPDANYADAGPDIRAHLLTADLAVADALQTFELELLQGIRSHLHEADDEFRILEQLAAHALRVRTRILFTANHTSEDP